MLVKTNLCLAFSIYGTISVHVSITLLQNSPSNAPSTFSDDTSLSVTHYIKAKFHAKQRPVCQSLCLPHIHQNHLTATTLHAQMQWVWLSIFVSSN